MDPRSEVLLRQADRFQGALLLAGLPADNLLQHLPEACAWSWHAGEFALLQQRFGQRVSFAVERPTVACNAAVLFVPKSRDLANYLIAALASQLAGGILYLVGEKRGGVESTAKRLSSLGNVRKLDSARHCQLWAIDIQNAPATPVLTALAKRYKLNQQELPLEVVTLPGVFSHGELDKGSALLIEHLAALPEGHFLDFGCGAGVIGALLKQRYPNSQVTLLDVDAFALASARLTLSANKLDAEVIAGNGIQAAPNNLSAIISNPPFHQGVKTDYSASETLLKEASRHLRAGGEIRLVANSFLRYPPLIEASFGHCDTLAEANGFKIYRATRR